MKIYLAACFEQQEEVRQKAKELRDLGFVVDCKWHYEDPKSDVLNSDILLAQTSSNDVEDILAADIFLMLNDKLSTRGGRQTEFGIAWANKKICIIVGDSDIRLRNIFYWLKNVIRTGNWSEAISRLVIVKNSRERELEYEDKWL